MTGGCIRSGTHTNRGPVCWTWNACCGSTEALFSNVCLTGWRKGGKSKQARRRRSPCELPNSRCWAENLRKTLNGKRKPAQRPLKVQRRWITSDYRKAEKLVFNDKMIYTVHDLRDD